MTCKYQDTGKFSEHFSVWRGTPKEKYLKHIKRLIALLRMNDLSDKHVDIRPSEDDEGILFRIYSTKECPLDRYIHLIDSFDDIVELEIDRAKVEDVDILSEIDSKSGIKRIDIKEIETTGDEGLDLSHLGSFQALEELKVSGININYASIGEIAGLEKLTLYPHFNIRIKYRHDNCAVIPDEVGNMKNLRHLRLRDWVHISDNLGNLKSLETLELMPRDQREIPAFITELSNLRKLAINCKSGYVPDISQLNKLEYLQLSAIELQAFPDVDKLPKSLTHLILDTNMIEKVPENILELENLRFLNLYQNNITDFHAELSELEHLEVLILWRNKIKSLPEELPGSFSNLKTLSLEENYIHEFPEWTVTLPALETVYLEPRDREPGWRYPERISQLAEDNGIELPYVNEL